MYCQYIHQFFGPHPIHWKHDLAFQSQVNLIPKIISATSTGYFFVSLQLVFISNFAPKNGVFSPFLLNYSNDFVHYWSECREEQYGSAEKNRTSKSFFVLEIFIHKVSIFGQNGKLEVQRSSNTYGTVHAMKNLIRYSESAENSLSQVSHQILPSSTSSGSNFYLFFIRNF